MTDDPDTEREAIRQEKRERLQERLEEGEGDDGAAPPSEPVHVESPAHLEELTAEHHAVLVDFYADWCGPCKMLEPVVESIAADGAAAVAKVDVDEQQALAGDAGVRGVPTLLVYVDGTPAERMVGVQDESRIRSVIDRLA
jgi:thioredoxin 1